MGVQNLWDLLAPVGRRVSVETLAGKKLAIDASIWMVQFMKAMRDEKGEMVRNAHILGFFRRICKLLFLRTKPVFVFDGGTPALKRRTVAARRRHRENARAKIRKTAEKLLLNHLKAKKLEELASELKNISKQNVDAKGKSVLMDDENGKVSSSDTRGTDGSVIGATDQEKIDEMLAASLAAEEAKLAGHEPPPSSSMNAEEDGDDDEEEIMFPVIHGNVDPTVLASLPPSMQLDLLIQMRERLMAENRQKYQKINKMPTQFSQLQIESYLKTVAFRREIDEVQKNAAGKGLGGVQTSRIASEANREFIFSSSFDGDKQMLAAGSILNNEQTKSGPLDLASKKPSSSQTKLISQEGFNEHFQKFRADDATCAEKDSLRVNRVSGLGAHMTRDLQRNLNLMKEHEHGHNYKESLGVAAPRSIKGNDVIISVGDEPFRFESNIVGGEILEISFSGDGCEEIDTDTVDDFFSRLVAGSSSSTFPSENPLEGISDQSESNIAWEEGMLEEISGNEQNNIQMDPQISHVNNMASEDDEVDWEEGVLVDLTTNTSCETENQRIVSRGNLEEEADVQEAIIRSLEDLGKEQLKVFNNKILTVEEAYKNTSLLIPKNSSPKGSQSPSARKVLGQLDHYIVENPSSPGKQLSSSIMRDHIYDLHLPVVDKPYQEMSVSVEANNFCSHPNEMHRKGNLEKGFTEKQGAIIPENIVSKELPQHGSNPLDMESVMKLPKAAEFMMINLDHLAEPLEAQINRNDLQIEREMPQATMGELEKGVVAEEPCTSFVQEISLLRQESERIGVEQRKLETIAESVSSEMFTECQELLQMFGLPYIIAPMEAEAQCAYMEIVNLVDGVVTDDSDVFLFGARSVYKNIFDDRKYVETYFMKDIETELGLTREKLIRMALLLGSDYTEGVSGIGIVNAIEVVNAFPEDDGLQKFREWIESPDLSILEKIDRHLHCVSKNSSRATGFDKEAHGNNSKDLPPVDTRFCRTDGQTMVDDISDEKRIFMNKHRNISKNWHIPPSFPSDSVISAYTSPQVDESTEPFSWGKPDLSFLRKLCWEKFGWSTQKADELLVPVLKEYNKHETQLRLEAFYSFNERFAKIRSKRIKRAVKGITGKLPAELADDDLPKGEAKSPITCNSQVGLNEYEGKTYRELLNENRNQQRSRGARGKGRLQGKRKPKRKVSLKPNFDTMELDSGASDDATMQTPEVTEVMHGTRRSARKKTRPNYAEVRLGGDTLDDLSEDLIDATAEKTVADNDGMAGETHEIEAERSVQIDNCLPMDVSLGEGLSLGKSNNDLSIVHKSKSGNKVQMTNEPHNHTKFDKRSPSDDVLIGSSSNSRRATKETTGGGETLVNTSVAEQICSSVFATNISEHNMSSDYLISGGGFCLNDEDDTLKVDSFYNASYADGAFAAPLEANLESSDTVQCTTMEESSNEDQSKSSAAAEERVSAPNKFSVNRDDSKKENELSSLSAMPSLRRKGRKS